ncbi:recombinase family protein [Pseudomonas qingdaonensis]|uniref:recombinase family protein n=1 Tax=Pseudomonas qingdaonensis TaxID=2056231 RepID=UPI00333FFABE
MPQAISYVRFSSLRQKHGNSVERQEQMIGHWLQDHLDYTLSALQYKDLGRSGYKGEHIKGGGFGKLLDAIQQGAIKSGDVVLVEAIDRTGRLDAVDMLGIIHPILSAGVSIITLDDNQTYNRESLNGSAIFLLAAKIQSAHQYSAALSRRIKASYETRKKAAKEKGVTPKRSTPVWLTSEGVLIERVAEQVRMAFDLYISGVGASTIAKRMRESGVPELAKVAGASVRRWITNRIAIGEWEVHKLDDSRPTEIIQNAYPPVVSLSIFQKAQMHKERVATKPVRKTAKHFLVGLMKCGVCGKNYVIQHRAGKTSSVRCRSNQMAGDCTNNAQLPKPVMDAILAWTGDRAKLDGVATLHTSVNEVGIAALRAEIEGVSFKITGLTETIKAIGAVKDVLDDLKLLNADRESMQARLTLLERSETPAAGQDWEYQAEMWWMEENDPERLSALMQQVGYAITVHPDKTITVTGTDTVYRYDGYDKGAKTFRLYQGERPMLVKTGDHCETGTIRRQEDWVEQGD